MDPNVASAIIGAISAFIVALITVLVARLADVRREQKQVRGDFLNPLRLYVEETHYRIEDMFRFPENRKYLAAASPEDISSQGPEWFNGAGCYLISSCYLNACLFAYMKRVRESIPYLRLRRTADTELLTRILRVSHEYLDDLGVFYVVQHSIGELMWDHMTNRVISYRGFCEALREPGQRVWFDRLLHFYFDVGSERRLDQLRRVQGALELLSRLLDKGAAIEARTRVEQSRRRSLNEASSCATTP